MDCRKYRKIILTTREADRTDSQLEYLGSHELHCEECARFGAEAKAMEGMLRAVPSEPAPQDFTRGVMARVEALDESAPASWYERVFGSLRAPAPMFSARQAIAVAALVLMMVSVGMLLGHGRLGVPPDAPPTISVASAPGGSVIEMDSEFVNELVARHQGAASLQPLPDDEGMRLVSY